VLSPVSGKSRWQEETAPGTGQARAEGRRLKYLVRSETKKATRLSERADLVERFAAHTFESIRRTLKSVESDMRREEPRLVPEFLKKARDMLKPNEGLHDLMAETKMDAGRKREVQRLKRWFLGFAENELPFREDEALSQEGFKEIVGGERLALTPNGAWLLALGAYRDGGGTSSELFSGEGLVGNYFPKKEIEDSCKTLKLSAKRNAEEMPLLAEAFHEFCAALFGEGNTDKLVKVCLENGRFTILVKMDPAAIVSNVARFADVGWSRRNGHDTALRALRFWSLSLVKTTEKEGDAEIAVIDKTRLPKVSSTKDNFTELLWER